MQSHVPVTISLPKRVLDTLRHVQVDRQDPTFSDTARVLLLQALGSLGYLTSDEVRALGIERIIPAQGQKIAVPIPKAVKQT